MRLSRALVFCVQLCLFGVLLSSAEAQTAPTKTASAKATPKVDPRYAVAAGAWSDAAISLFNTWGALDDNPGRHVSFYSPDHKKLIEVEGENVFLRVGGRTFKTDISNDTKHDAELSWSPDSTKYFITWTESGELGPWHMQVYGVDDSGLHEFPKVEEPARKDFERQIRQMPIDPELDTPQSRSIWKSDEYCEPYHVIGGRWLNGSKEILLSVLVEDTSGSRYMGEFNVYRVNAVTGQILQRYTAEDVRKQFGHKYLPLKAH